MSGGSKKIFHIISGDLWAGAEMQVFTTLNDLKDDKRFKIICILFNEGILEERLKERNIDVIVTNENIFNSFRIFTVLRKFFKNYKPDIIHVHHIKEHFLGASASLFFFKKIPIVRTVHGLSGVPERLKTRQRIRSSLVVHLDKYLLKYLAKSIIAVSSDMRERLFAQNLSNKTKQINNAVFLDLNNIKKSRKQIRDEYNIGDSFWIGTAARLVEPKNLDMLIEAAKILRDQKILFKVSIFGEGPLKQKLKKKISQYDLDNCVILCGFKKNIYEIINAFDLFVMCSKHEGMPYALLEAMYIGKPIVCTAAGGMKEIIENEHNGLIVESGSVIDLANKIIDLIKNPLKSKKLAENASMTVKSQYSIDKSNAELKRLYFSI